MIAEMLKKKSYSCLFEGHWAVMPLHKQIIITDKNSDMVLNVSADVSQRAAPQEVEVGY